MARRFTLLILAALLTGCAADAPYEEVEVLAHDVALPAAILWRHPYPTLVVEVDHVEGRRPLDTTLEAILQTLREETSKEEVSVLEPTLIPGTPGRVGYEWSLDELRALHDRTFDLAPARAAVGRDAALPIHVMFLDGNYRDEDGSTAVGLQDGSALFIFSDGIYSGASDRLGLPPWPTDPDAERHTAIHELGHAMGLVHCGIPMLTPRQAAGCHSTDPHSPMKTYDLRDSVAHEAEEGGWAAWRFTEEDRRDLAAFRESEPRAG